MKSAARAEQQWPQAHFFISSKNVSKLWSDYGRDWYYERILKIFSFLESAAQIAQKCTKPFFSISLFKKSDTLTIDRNVWLKFFLIFRYGSPILNIFGFLKSVAQAALKCPKPFFSISHFKKSCMLTIDRNVWLKKLLIFRYGSQILNIFGFLK